MITLVGEVGKLLFQFKNVSKHFGIHWVFRNLNFSLERGTFSILTGPSGSGKTTLFRMLCGIDRASEGEVVFLGRRLMDHSPAHLKQIGLVFQGPRGLADRTVIDNVGLPLEVDGIERDEREQRVLEWLDTLGLRPRAKSLYGDLSGGELQKAEFARALIRQPRLILADEPTAHLDAVQADMLLDILWEQYQNGATVFISTHHPPQFSHPSIRRYHLKNLGVVELSDEEVSRGIVRDRVEEPIEEFFQS